LFSTLMVPSKTVDVLKQCVVERDTLESVMFRRIVRMEAVVLHAAIALVN
jgi:hypothetical protein